MSTTRPPSYKIRVKRQLISRLDAHQVAKLVSLPLPNRPKQRDRKKRRHIRKLGCVQGHDEVSNEDRVGRSSQSSNPFEICSPLLRKEEPPSQHSRLCLQNCSWLFTLRDPLETRRPLLPTSSQLKDPRLTSSSMIGWQTAWDSHIEILWEIYGLPQNFFNGEVAIPDQWGPFKGQEIRSVNRGAVDSNYSLHTESRGLTPDMSSENDISAGEVLYTDYSHPKDPYASIAVLFPKLLSNSKSRSQWSFLDIMCPSSFNGWRLVNDRDLKSWDTRRASGNMMHNDESQDSDIWSSNSLARFLTTTCDSWTPRLFKWYNVEEELSDRMKLASLFASIMKTDITSTHCLERSSPLSVLTPCSHPVFSDVVAIPNEAVLPRVHNSPIVLFAAQYLSGDPEEAIIRLAHSLQSGINILILYYLETRLEAHDGAMQRLPNWMYLYGIIYSESVIRIYVHYPLYQPEPTTGSSETGWLARSASIELDLDGVFRRRHSGRESAVAALLRIQSHTRFVLNRLRLWDGFHRMA